MLLAGFGIVKHDRIRTDDGAVSNRHAAGFHDAIFEQVGLRARIFVERDLVADPHEIMFGNIGRVGASFVKRLGATSSSAPSANALHIVSMDMSNAVLKPPNTRSLSSMAGLHLRTAGSGRRWPRQDARMPARIPSRRKRQIDGCLAMNPCRIEDRHRHIALVQQHAYFRAAKDHAVSPDVHQTLGNVFEFRTALVLDDVHAELIIDDAMHLCPVIFVWNNWVK